MFLHPSINKKIALAVGFILICVNLSAQQTPTVAAPSLGNNLLAILLILTAVVLAFVIWGMGQVLIALSRQLLDKSKAASKAVIVSTIILLTFISQQLIAQNAPVTNVVQSLPNYGGLSAQTFYLLASVIVIEILTLLFLFFSIKRIYDELVPAKAAAIAKQSNWVALWKKWDAKLFTKAIPIEKEADIMLDHNYDGIQELNNALPPWWKYGFIITIGFAVVYLLNFHVLGNGKNPTEEYAEEMSSAQIEKEAYEGKNKDKIDEAHVPMADAIGINRGKEIFLTNCVACHGTKGEGGVGPNLTDNYWIHKGSLNDIYNTIKKGYSDKGMQSWAIKFNPKEMSELASFIKTLKGTNPPNGKIPQGDLFNETSAGADSTKLSKPNDSSTTNSSVSASIK